MTNEDKSVLIGGLMFLSLSTALAITGLFFMKALGIGLLAAVVTYVFFDTCYYEKKTDTHADEYQSVVKKITT
ncbi:hypothetical protein BUZ54_03070 [Staphylococcus hominis]|uniref:hypothetical protein n=1 Tax=Staphylococcus hominis TaxID=1290 RepID=UPI000D1F6B8D|nr:hypothetical protein [Staphylococcus hominis]PTK26504.1 hypothetical protein BUZ54_03070 [Staphylococcus hominis]